MVQIILPVWILLPFRIAFKPIGDGMIHTGTLFNTSVSFERDLDTGSLLGEL